VSAAARLRALCLALVLLGVPPEAGAQPAGRVYRLGFLSTYSATANAEGVAALFAALREAGYEEGRNLVVERRYADGKVERLPALAAELVRARVDVILAQTTPAALAAKRATSTVPIVIPTSGDAVGSGLVASLARPGGNVTGLQFLGPELAVKQLELLKETAPGVTRVGLLAHPRFPPEVTFLREMERHAPSLGVEVRLVEAKTAADHAAAFAAIAGHRINGLVVAGSVYNHDPWTRVVELAARQRIPAIYPGREWVEAGGLMSYFADRKALYRRAAVFVDRLFQGARAADLPMEQPTKFELVVNVKTARALGLVVPRSVLLRADELVE
jgi:putative ABC transport system substrate-binding protein